ncbi:hypothetical protein A9Q96_16715 [Rhodobacterales bacterium 52_120_T64]|nr:hypothetical protein A9Q96_16715 [Rhodobacterales bacterium 52_120_T64]
MDILPIGFSTNISQYSVKYGIDRKLCDRTKSRPVATGLLSGLQFPSLWKFVAADRQAALDCQLRYS